MPWIVPDVFAKLWTIPTRCCVTWFEAELAFLPLHSGDADDFGTAKGLEAVRQGYTDVDLGGLAVGVSGSDAVSEGLQASHLGLNPTSSVIAGPALSEGPAEVLGRLQGFVPGPGGRTVLLPHSAVAPDGDDGGSASLDNRGVAFAGVVGAVSGNRAKGLVWRNLRQKPWQDRAVAFAA